RGRAVPNFVHWEDLDINYVTKARIDQALCIKCGLCYIACEDTAHQAIAAQLANGSRHFEVIDAECVGCNLCMHVCPVEDCITMIEQPSEKPKLTWKHHPNNPMRLEAAE